MALTLKSIILERDDMLPSENRTPIDKIEVEMFKKNLRDKSISEIKIGFNLEFDPTQYDLIIFRDLNNNTRVLVTRYTTEELDHRHDMLYMS